MSDPMPANIDAERAVIGSIFLDRDCLGAIETWFEPEMFSSERHAVIYRAQLACYRQRIPPDLVTVVDRLQCQQDLERVGGIAYLLECTNSVPTAVHLEYYAQIVERKHALRRIIEAGSKIARLGYSSTDDVDAVVNEAEALIQGIERQTMNQGPVSVGIILEEVYDNLQRVQMDGGTIGIPTGFYDLDVVLGGLQNSDLLLIAARPSLGKTSFALSLALNMAMNQHSSVAFFSLEMSRTQLVQRLLAMQTGISMQHLRTGAIAGDDVGRLMQAMGELSSLSIAIDDAPGVLVRDIRSRALRIQARQGLDVLIIDYLQLIKGRRQSENRNHEVSEISRGLKELARELNVPVLALSQLSRAVENRQSHVPMLSDLRDSGSLEQDADIVMFIYRDDHYNPTTEHSGIAEIHVAKHRNGPTDTVRLHFRAETTRFANLERHRDVVAEYVRGGHYATR